MKKFTTEQKSILSTNNLMGGMTSFLESLEDITNDQDIIPLLEIQYKIDKLDNEGENIDDLQEDLIKKSNFLYERYDLSFIE